MQQQRVDERHGAQRQTTPHRHVHRRPSQGSLDEHAQLSLARWAFKTACILANLQRDAPAILPVNSWSSVKRTSSLLEFRYGSEPHRSSRFSKDFVGGELRWPVQRRLQDGRSIDGVIPGYQVRFRLNVLFEIKGLNPEVPGVPGGYIDVVTKGNLRRTLFPIWPVRTHQGLLAFGREPRRDRWLEGPGGRARARDH